MLQELSLNILDVAQNSVKAGASLITIAVEEDEQEDLLIIAIGDNGCGMTPQQVDRVTDPFYTTRTTRKVGLGVPFLKMACEMTGGSFDIRSQPGVGTTVTARLGLHNIDRTPLGDVASTVTSLIQCNPDIDFVYSHKTAAGEFAADTREFRQVLEGIPLSAPEVIGFIKEYILEHLNEIQGGTI